MPSRRLRILHLVHSLEAGGMENGLVNVARGLDPEQFEIHVACLERRGAFAERLPNPENLRVLGKTDRFSWRAVRALGAEISRLHPHVLHTHNLGPLIYGSLATRFGLRCPIVQGEHAELTPSEQSPRRLFQRRLLYRSCRSIHTVSQSLTNQLIGLGFPRTKIITILNGVDTARFAPGDRSAARTQIGLPANAVCVGIVGRFGPFKRHSLLIDAFEQMAMRHPWLHLLIVGSGGPEQANVTERAQKSAALDRIHLVGFQSNTPLYYRAMNLLVAPSVNEGLSNAVLEAMACGIPVLAHSACGNLEAISDGTDGYVAELNTVGQLQTHIEAALSNSGRSTALSLRAREKAISRFSLDQMTSAYAQLYRAAATPRE